MKAGKWDQIKELFSSALERDPSQRSAFLREACGGDDALRVEVESLLSSYNHADSFIDRPAGETTLDTTGEPLTGQRIGSYQVIREIGSGGMAVVYLAMRADDQYRKRVAIKLVKKGLDLDEIPRRFRNERQTLAALDHPNIVKLLDGGSTQEGLPYLVMDYVEGMPITEYCDSRRLSINDRLELFRIVCGAVHYAHQNLVIHRDLKPGNILVTAEGVPKLLDFGIAKLLNPEFSAHTLLVTQTDQRLMTPEYASPEQFRGQLVTTATDVYSLGVLLYELLTGYRPYRLKDQSLREIERAICEVEPEKPSTVVTQRSDISSSEGTTQTGLTPELVSQTREGRPEKLRRRLLGDLDNVVLMALRKEPQRRYASAEQFSQDIRRHLEGLPVTARPATLRYRASKFVRRHTAGVAAAAGVLLILLAGIVITAREASIARAEKARAERRFNDVRHLANSFLFDFDDAIKNLAGATPARELVVRKALEYLDSLAQEAAKDSSLQTELAEAYLKVGDVQGYPYSASLGDTPGALASYQKALAIAEKLSHADPNNAFARRYLARSQQRVGAALLQSGKPLPAAQTLRTAIATFEALPEKELKDPDVQLSLASSYNVLGDSLGGNAFMNAGDNAGALDSWNKSLEIYERLSAQNPTNARIAGGLAIAYTKIGDSHQDRGDASAALVHYRQAAKIYEAVIQREPSDARSRRDLSAIRLRAARSLFNLGDKQGALKEVSKLVEEDEAFSRLDTTDALARDGLWLDYMNLSEMLEEKGYKKEALEGYRKGLAVIEHLSQKQPTNLTYRSKLSGTLVEVGEFLLKMGGQTEGRELIKRGISIEKSLADRPGATPGELTDYAKNAMSCEPAYPCDPQSAQAYAKRAVEMTKANDPDCLDALAMAYFKIGEVAKAVETEQKALLLLPTSETADSPARKQYEANLAKFKKATHQK